MKNKLFNCLLVSIFLISQISFSQTEYDMDPDIVELDEIILSLPFNQDRGKSVIKVNKINLNSINPILKSYISKSFAGIGMLSTIILHNLLSKYFFIMSKLHLIQLLKIIDNH